MKEKLLALLKTLGLLPDDKVEAVSKELDKLELEKKPDTPIDASKITDPALKAVIEGMQSQNAVLGQQVKDLTSMLTAERNDREKAVKIQQDAEKKNKEQKVADLLAKALKEGKIVKAKEEWLKKFAEADVAAAEEWVKDAPVDKNFKPDTGSQKKEGEQEKNEGDVRSPLSAVNPTLLSKIHEMSGTSNN